MRPRTPRPDSARFLSHRDRPSQRPPAGLPPGAGSKRPSPAGFHPEDARCPTVPALAARHGPAGGGFRVPDAAGARREAECLRRPSIAASRPGSDSGPSSASAPMRAPLSARSNGHGVFLRSASRSRACPRRPGRAGAIGRALGRRRSDTAEFAAVRDRPRCRSRAVTGAIRLSLDRRTRRLRLAFPASPLPTEAPPAPGRQSPAVLRRSSPGVCLTRVVLYADSAFFFSTARTVAAVHFDRDRGPRPPGLTTFRNRYIRVTDVGGTGLL